MPKGDPTPGWPQNGCTGKNMSSVKPIIKPLPQKNGNSTIWWPPTCSWDDGRAVESIQRTSGPSPPRTSLVHGYGQLDLQMVSRSSKTSHRAFPGQVKKGIGWRRCHCWVCHTGPKTYGFCTHLGTLECKVHGFRLNIRGQQQLNFNLLKQNVLEEGQQPQDQPVNSLLVNLSSRLL